MKKIRGVARIALSCLVLPLIILLSSMGILHAQTYPIVSTGQSNCFDTLAVIAPPLPGQPYYGQDVQHPGTQPSYTQSKDGLTVHDNVTGLTWQNSPDTNGDGLVSVLDKLTFTGAVDRPAVLNAIKFGGYSDWRLPSIKELYSLINFNGMEPSPMSGPDTRGLMPFIDTVYFRFCYGDVTAGERVIDAQYATSTSYTSKTFGVMETMFGVNFADGRIKGYPKGQLPNGQYEMYFVLCVRGNALYGNNDFLSNGDGTITDRATGLMWTQDDSRTSMNWPEALAWVQARNASKHLGYSDWRLPSVKELQSIVDYKRGPDSTRSAAIDPVFTSTQITNEANQTDFPCYWSSTTHCSFTPSGPAGSTGAYVAFGRALGYMFNAWLDVHGAGCQRSDPKTGNPAEFPNGRGPQGDAIRIYNYVRPVRSLGAATGVHDVPAHPSHGMLGQNHPNPFWPTTVIPFQLGLAENVVLRIYDSFGRLASELVNGEMASGRHQALFDAGSLPAGVYYCRLSTGAGIETIKLVLAQ
jgi:hypothetical protein